MVFFVVELDARLLVLVFWYWYKIKIIYYIKYKVTMYVYYVLPYTIIFHTEYPLSTAGTCILHL